MELRCIFMDLVLQHNLGAFPESKISEPLKTHHLFLILHVSYAWPIFSHIFEIRFLEPLL